MTEKHECNTCKHRDTDFKTGDRCFLCIFKHIDGWEARTWRLFADSSPDNGSDDKVITYDAKTPRKCLDGACAGISTTQ
jgi:hypothetical protein